MGVFLSYLCNSQVISCLNAVFQISTFKHAYFYRPKYGIEHPAASCHTIAIYPNRWGAFITLVICYQLDEIRFSSG